MKSLGIIRDEDGDTTLKGDIILVVAVDKDIDDYNGKISYDRNEVDGFDFLTLAMVVLKQCFEDAVKLGVDPEAAQNTLMTVMNELVGVN